jgi:hypothetical protein
MTDRNKFTLGLSTIMGNFFAIRVADNSKLPKYSYWNEKSKKFSRSPDQQALIDAVKKNPYQTPKIIQPFKNFSWYLTRYLNSGLITGIPNSRGEILVVLDIDLALDGFSAKTRIFRGIANQWIPKNYLEGCVIGSPSGGVHILFFLPPDLPAEDVKKICKNLSHEKFKSIFGLSKINFIASPGSYICSPLNSVSTGEYLPIAINKPQTLPEKFINKLLKKSPKNFTSPPSLLKDNTKKNQIDENRLISGIDLNQLAEGLNFDRGNRNNSLFQLALKYFNCHPDFRSSLKNFASNQLFKFASNLPDPEPDHNIRTTIESASREEYASASPGNEWKIILLKYIKYKFLECLTLNEKDKKLRFKHFQHGEFLCSDYKTFVNFLTLKNLMRPPDPKDESVYNLINLNYNLGVEERYLEDIKKFNQNHIFFNHYQEFGEIVDGRVMHRSPLPKNQPKIFALYTAEKRFGKDVAVQRFTSKIKICCSYKKIKLYHQNTEFDPSISPLDKKVKEKIKNFPNNKYNPWLLEDTSVPYCRYRTDRFGYDCYWPILDDDGNIINHDNADYYIDLYLGAWNQLLPTTVQRELVLKLQSKIVWNPNQLGSSRCGLIIGIYDHDGGTGKSFLLELLVKLLNPFAKLITDPRAVFGKNNSTIEGLIFAFLDEAQMENSAHQHSAMKNLATSETLWVQDKYIKRYQIKNHSHIFWAANRVDKNPVTQHDRRSRICDAYNIDVEKFIIPLAKACKEQNFFYFIAEYLKEEIFIPNNIRNFTTVDWENQPFDGEIWRAKKIDTDYGNFLWTELTSYPTPEKFIEVYEKILPGISHNWIDFNSIKLTQQELGIIFQNVLKKENLYFNHHARGVHITQVIKEIRGKYFEDFRCEKTTRDGVKNRYYKIYFNKQNSDF